MFAILTKSYHQHGSSYRFYRWFLSLFYSFFLQLFKFTASSSAEVVAPGLSVSGLLEFTPEEDEEVRDCLLIHIDDVETIEIPLLG